MSTRRILTANSAIIYIIITIVIAMAFIMLGGGSWVRGMMHGNSTIGMTNWNWIHILVSLLLGFLLGVIFIRRK
jgi:H+/Cl- antiporter ClcA